MKYYEASDLLDKRPCARIRADLKNCLLESDCCRKQKRLPRDCIKNPQGQVPAECFLLRSAFFECKRSVLDMRTRFRGRKGSGF